METYLLKFSISLLIFWCIHICVLERLNMHILKRFYLLGSIVLSLIMPLITITLYIEPAVVSEPLYPEVLSASTYVNSESFPTIQAIPETSVSLPIILWTIYGTGVFIFLFRFIQNLVNLYTRIHKNEVLNKQPLVYVLLHQFIIPHSFFKYIFLNKTEFLNNSIPAEVILHEETHAKQLHSLDILFIELVQTVLWFHPLVYIIKHHIKLNHEFLADQAVINQGISVKHYQNLLLDFSSNTQNHQLTSAINYSSIKKRFTVMKTKTSKRNVWFSTILMIPIVSILVYSLSNKRFVELPITSEAISQNTGSTLENGASRLQMNEYLSFIEDYKKTNIINGTKYERAIVIYDQLMSNDQRNSVEKYPKRIIPDSNLSQVKSRPISRTKYEALKNKDTYAVWIDGTHVLNSELNNYSYTDFVHHTGSVVYKNARSKAFPQPYQFQLYTKTGFHNSFELSQVNKYKTATKTYTDALGKFLKGTREDNSELKLLKARADKIYETLSSEEIKKHKLGTPPPIPAVKTTPKTNLKHKPEQQNKGIQLALNTNNTLTAPNFEDHSKHTARSISIDILNNDTYAIDGKITPKKDLTKAVNELHSDITSTIRNKIMNIHLTSKNEISNKEVWYVYNSLLEYGFHRLVTKDQEVIKSKGNTPFKTESTAQETDPFSYVSGTLSLNDGQTLYYITQNTTTTYYNRYGQIVDKKGTILNSEQTKATDVIEGQVISKVYKDNTPIVEFEEDKTNLNEATIRKRVIYISISENGEYAIAKDNTLKSFEAISLEQIKRLFSKFSSDDLQNTFIFASGKDLKAYRSKPSNTPEYFDDIEIYLIRHENSNKLKEVLETGSKHLGTAIFSYELALDNGLELKRPTHKLAGILKTFEGIHTSL